VAEVIDLYRQNRAQAGGKGTPNIGPFSCCFGFAVNGYFLIFGFSQRVAKNCCGDRERIAIESVVGPVTSYRTLLAPPHSGPLSAPGALVHFV
jgi:hypothetical protein